MISRALLDAAADCESHLAAGWSLVEMLSLPGPGHTVEDAVLVAGNFVGIFDGCTSKRRDWTHKSSPGYLAALVVSSAFAGMDRDATCAEAVEHVSAALVSGLEAHGVEPDGGEPPSTTILVVSLHRDELWCVGGGHARVDGAAMTFPAPPSDAVVAQARSLYQALLVAGGTAPDEVLAADPAHDLVLPLREQQWHVRNDASSPWGYGAVDGRTVPAAFCHAVPLDGAREVALASDGYLSAAATLEAAEGELDRLAEVDPLGSPSTKARPAGSVAFDDRSYVRLRR